MSGMKKNKISAFIRIVKCVEFFLVRIACYAVSLFPLKLVLFFADLLGILAYYLFTKRRKIVFDNISLIHDWTNTADFNKDNFNQEIISKLFNGLERKQLVKKIFQRNAVNFLASLVLITKNDEFIRKHVKILNSEILEKKISEKKGLIVLFAHQGPWELISKLPEFLDFSSTNKAPKLEMASIYRPLNNYYLDNWFFKKRAKSGMQLFSREDGFLKIIRYLKNEGILFTAIDQRIKQGTQSFLFGKLASTTNLVNTFHNTSNAPLVYMSFIKTGSTSWELEFFDFNSKDVKLQSKKLFNDYMNKRLEEVILISPMDYFFFQDRYKL